MSVEHLSRHRRQLRFSVGEIGAQFEYCPVEPPVYGQKAALACHETSRTAPDAAEIGNNVTTAKIEQRFHMIEPLAPLARASLAPIELGAVEGLGIIGVEEIVRLFAFLQGRKGQALVDPVVARLRRDVPPHDRRRTGRVVCRRSPRP